MDRQSARMVSYYLRLHYPMRVTAAANGFRGSYPDLPGCDCTDWDLPTLYATLEQRRRDWIADRVQTGEAMPMPNSHVSPVSPAEQETLAPPQPVRTMSLAVAASA